MTGRRVKQVISAVRNLYVKMKGRNFLVIDVPLFEQGALLWYQKL